MAETSSAGGCEQAAARLGVPSSQIEDMVAANHILYAQGVVDGFGHISMRHPADPDRFILSRSMAPALVGPDDLMCFDRDGQACDDSRVSYVERFIHSEIYKARPDVFSIVHSHSPAVIPFGVVKSSSLRPICHMCGFLPVSGTPVFEIRCEAGTGSDLLIRSAELGAALARKLSDDATVLMRGHGSTTVGGNVRQAVFRAIYTEANARLQLEASRLGEIEFLTAEEAARASAANDQHIGRAWSLWARAVATGQPES